MVIATEHERPLPYFSRGCALRTPERTRHRGRTSAAAARARAS
jgi:hypothetical protein